jgi:hypothetical protein
MTTTSLAIGTWLVSFAADILNAATAGSCDLGTTVATGTATFVGVRSGSVGLQGTGTTRPQSTSFTFLLTVTAAATLTFSAYSQIATSVKAVSPVDSFAAATGWTAVRIA